MYVFRNVIYKTLFDDKSKVLPDYVRKPDFLCVQLRLWGLIALFGLGPICVFITICEQRGVKKAVRTILRQSELESDVMDTAHLPKTVTRGNITGFRVYLLLHATHGGLQIAPE